MHGKYFPCIYILCAFLVSLSLVGDFGYAQSPRLNQVAASIERSRNERCRSLGVKTFHRKITHGLSVSSGIHS